MVKWHKYLPPVLIAVLLTSSCYIVEIGSADGGSSGIWSAPPASGGSKPQEHHICYMTTVEYPPEYNWRTDLQKGEVKCSLVVYADEVPKLKLAAGDSYQVSADTDMHRTVNGNLYTFFPAGGMTIVKKNGVELFRYSGEENIYGLCEDGMSVYTLGQSRRGQGFSFRKDGNAVFARDRGYVYEHLQHTPQGYIFAFYEVVASETGRIARQYMVKDSVALQVAVRDDIEYVWDVVLHGEGPCYVANMTGIRGLVLVDGQDMTALPVEEDSGIYTARILLSGEDIFVEGVISDDVGFRSIIWKDGRSVGTFSQGMTVASVDCDAGSLCCALNSSFHAGGGQIYRNGELTDYPSGYSSASDRTTAFIDGILRVGLSSVTCAHPLLWKDGEVKELKINGFISELSSM